MDNINASVKKEGVIRGLLFGVILLLVNIGIMYFTAYSVHSPVAFFIVSIIAPLVIMAILALFFVSNLRKKIGGYWTQKQSVTGIFFILIVTYVISGIGRWAFSRFADPQMVEQATATTLTMRRAAVLSAGGSAEAANKTVAELQKQISDSKNITVGSVIQNVVLSVILIFAVSFILAALFKRERRPVTN